MRDSSNTPVSVVSSTLSAAESDHSSAVSQTTTAAAVSTQYVDDELLWGVAMGWGVPAVTPAMKPMLGPVPNVVSLPYARSAPFHIRAPSWRHLLKLMARLGNTRLEPSVEAIAEVKTLMQLRVVVSFVKTHETLPDWNTVLYMTIDQAPPGTSPHVLKYRIGDTTTLPYSYTQSTPLMVLREGADASMSKFYTIPSTQKTPYPSLPITFPNLATYLASALDDSRGAHDNTTGMRRLAKFVDMFYPSESGATEAAAFRQGVGQKLMSFVGIGRRQQPRDRNAETFDLVTPFVADDFGR
ncbi:hypothetical protein B0H21DRAFT_684587 [Amylocystis lapponica]|nr:hypothetical protein B0H21DRAFT_684587 [Amylocystis lapponica]